MRFVENGSTPISSPFRRRHRTWWGAGAILASLAALGGYVQWTWVDRGAPIDSVAVLSFESATRDAETESLALGLPESISSSLLSLEGLAVKSPTVLRRYKENPASPRTVSQEQGVQAVLTGRVEKRDNQLLVRVELIDGKKNQLLWGRRYDSTLDDLFRVEEDIARQVAQALRLELTHEEDTRLAERGTRNLEAYNAYRLGRYHIQRWPSTDLKESFTPAVPYFKKAIGADPLFQEPYYWLGSLHFATGRSYYKESPDDFQRARDYW